MPTLSDLLADPSSSIYLVVKISYLSPLSVESVEWVSQHGWTDPANGPVAAFIPGLLETGVQISQHIDPLNLQEAFGTYTQLTLINNDPNYRGHYDSWHRISIDDREILIYLVGVLSSGIRVELADVLTTPLFSLRGVELPEVGESRVTLTVRDDSHSLDSALQPVTYSPPCLAFPGLTTAAGYVDFGDNFDQTASFSVAGWVYLEDPTVPYQYIFNKLSGFTGYSIDVGATVNFVIGAQTPPTTTAAAGLLHAHFWHYISFSVNTATGVREIGIDGVSVATTSSVSSSPNANTTACKFGQGLRGKLSRWTFWGSAKTVAAMWAEARTPVLPTASGLTAYIPPDEGVGNTVHDRKNASSITGAKGSTVLWDVASWHLASIAGSYRPYVLGTVSRVPVTWIDPANQIGEVSYLGCALISEVQSNQNALGAIWSPNLAAGTFQVTSGALSGTYSATVTANNLWGTALKVISTSTILAAINSISGPCTLCVQFTPSKSQADATNKPAIIGWRTGSPAAAGSISLRYSATGGANRLEAYCVNNAGTVFTLSTNTNLSEGHTYSLALRRNATSLDISVDGEQIATVAISGTFSTIITAFGIGVRGDGAAATQAEGRYDEPLIFSRALTQDEMRALHLLPATGSESNLAYGWHLDDATGSTAVSLLAGTALTLTNTSWVGGRSSAADLARKIYYQAGFVAGDLDTSSWRTECLNLNPSDCGWFIGNGETSLDILRLILGGLGFVPYLYAGTIHIRQFMGLTGVPDAIYTARREIRQGDISSAQHDPPVWEHRLLYDHNNVKQDAANIAATLASTDPDRYQYGQLDNRTIIRNDYSIKANADGTPGRFPSAVSKVCQTTLLSSRDTTNEAIRLLALHRDGSDTKTIPMWLLMGNNTILTEVAFDVAEVELNLSDWVVIGIECQDAEVTATVWRPASQSYVTAVRVSDAGDTMVTDESGVRVVD